MSIGASSNFNSLKVAELLFEKKIISRGLRTVNDLIATPEFQVLKIIGQNDPISAEMVETKYETQISLSMIFSNLQADNLISQSADYKWTISKWLYTQISHINIQETNVVEKIKEEQIEFQEKTFRDAKKIEYKKMADALIGTTYVSSNFLSIAELTKIPELEVLMIINKNQPIRTEEIEENLSIEASLSMIISNLQADNLITGTEGFAWKLSDQFMKKLDEVENKDQVVESTNHEKKATPHVGLSANESFILESRQLLKAVLDMNYFEDKSIDEIVQTSEFKILNIIYSHSPISVTDIDDKLDVDVPITLLISNLNADRLIMELDMAWILEDNFRRSINKIKISREEILQQITEQEKYMADKGEIPDSEDQINVEEEVISIDDTVEIVEDTEEIVEEKEPTSEIKQPSQESFRPVLKTIEKSNPIISVLKEIGYIKSEKLDKAELEEIPEYQVLTIIKNHFPISAEELETRAETTSISLILSNLQADRLITQDNNFRYMLSDKLSSMYSVDNKKEVDHVRIKAEKTRMDKEREERETEEKKENELKQLIIGTQKAGYIKSTEIPIKELLEIPEFEILKLIQDHGTIHIDKLKSIATSVSPVLISRTISKLLADERIEEHEDGIWQFSSSFKNLLIEDELKKQAEKTEKESKKREEEKMRLLKEKEYRLQSLANYLIEKSYIRPESTSIKHLLEIPEFEILAIISDEGPISSEKIKTKTESVSPVLIGRTIAKMEADGMIKKHPDDTWEISDKLKVDLKNY